MASYIFQESHRAGMMYLMPSTLIILPGISTTLLLLHSTRHPYHLPHGKLRFSPSSHPGSVDIHLSPTIRPHSAILLSCKKNVDLSVDPGISSFYSQATAAAKGFCFLQNMTLDDGTFDTQPILGLKELTTFTLTYHVNH
jgi:hypothetical protein